LRHSSRAGGAGVARRFAYIVNSKRFIHKQLCEAGHKF
jgi:hypothetical protein